jgi:hypothetical protein
VHVHESATVGFTNVVPFAGKKFDGGFGGVTTGAQAHDAFAFM